MHPRHQRFVEEYLIDLNAAAAARRAGYPPEFAGPRGCKLLYRKDIREAIRAAMADRAARTQITADRVLREWGRIAFSDLARVEEEPGSRRIAALSEPAPGEANLAAPQD